MFYSVSHPRVSATEFIAMLDNILQKLQFLCFNTLTISLAVNCK